MAKLYGGRVPALCAQTQDYFRDVYDHLYRVNAALDSIRDTVATAIQVNLSMVTIEQSDIAKRLAGWAAIFAVATTIVGVWGMNFEHMPELKWAYGYPIALAVIGAVCGVLCTVYSITASAASNGCDGAAPEGRPARLSPPGSDRRSNVDVIADNSDGG